MGSDLFKGVPRVEPEEKPREKRAGSCDWRGCLLDAEVLVVYHGGEDDWERPLCKKHAEHALALASVPATLKEKE